MAIGDTVPDYLKCSVKAKMVFYIVIHDFNTCIPFNSTPISQQKAGKAHLVPLLRRAEILVPKCKKRHLSPTNTCKRP
jgi:hypothetical protein